MYHTVLTICNYYGNFIEVERIANITIGVVTKALKTQFARYGVPDMVVSDNGPQFSLMEFATFCKRRRFTYVISSPPYPQSNGKAENAAHADTQMTVQEVS